jgi:hypothetical protein
MIRLMTGMPPTVAVAASANPNPITGTNTSLSVLGADDGGEASLTYTWSTTGTPPGPVSFSANGTNASKTTTATFSKAGPYAFRVRITDTSGLSTTSNLAVTVQQTLNTVRVSPATATISTGGTQQFNATASDQFNSGMLSQPAFTWSVTSGGGTVNSTGLFVAPSVAGTSVVTASSAGVSGSAAVTIEVALPAAPTGLTARGLGKRKLKLSWIDHATNESGFYVQTSTDGVNWTTIATLSPSTGSSGTVSYVTGSFPAGLRYVRVQAFNGFGSSTSNVVPIQL